MDFSTLEKRQLACLREVEINRRFGPALYLGCVPITRSAAGTLAFSGAGEIVEWAVHMRRFDQSALLSNLAMTRRHIGRSRKTARPMLSMSSHAEPSVVRHLQAQSPSANSRSSVCSSLRNSGAFARRRGIGFARQIEEQLKTCRRHAR